MKGKFFIGALLMISFFTTANAQRYRNQNNLGSEEMVKFVALKNGDILEFNWAINSTRKIKSIELRKGSIHANSVEWETVKVITADDKKYVDYLPDLGQVFYKLILIGADGKTTEYDPQFKLKKDDATARL